MIKEYKHQTVSLKHNDKSNVVFDLSDAGTGKTYVRVKAFAKRRKQKKGALLVLAPRSLLRSVWFKDFKTFAPNLTVSVATAANREAAFKEDADVYVTNPDAVKWLAQQPKAFFARFSELVIDESTAFKHHTSQRSKALGRIVKYFKYRAAMTATPNGRSITDVWHQAYVLDDGLRLGTSFYKFRDTVCTPKQVGRDPNALSWTDKEGAEEAVFGLLSDIVVRHELDDCADIPPNHQYSVDYELTPKQLTAYLSMQDTQMLTLFPQALTARMTGKPVPPDVMAINAAAVATKLLQISSGAVYDSAGKAHNVENGRYELVLDLIEQRKHSLAFFFWKHQRDALIAEAEKRKITYAVIDGETNDTKRAEIVRLYQAGAYQTLFAHPKSAAHGLTLTKGTATIWSSPTYDLEIFVQGSSRQRRLGQTEKTETIVIVAKDTLEEKVYNMMLAKDARMTNLLDLFSTLQKDKK